MNVNLTSTQLKNVTMVLSVTASDGYLYNWVTGFDDNDDGMLNDRPAGVGIWTLRASPTWSMSGRLTYNLPLRIGERAGQRRRRSDTDPACSSASTT